ncbi:hypothetical protein B0I33_1095 [Prauserella shujinwangii]|uniref:Uncharacterized protein n=1 Tax=Prauserella shujinwangii TaxID=1453103 RepID=A0A2T0LPU3_9PSEU|nr:hypothetical protein [Prauserella shujinwangii]PRX45344.1 hypothetical protein B0I33_1095 [Prauserella shujinwangii]
MSERAFPLPLPESGQDPRFTFGLLADVIEVLRRHGYPTGRMRALDYVELQQALFRFLYEAPAPGPEGGEW